jgi:hypothetical protein
MTERMFPIQCGPAIPWSVIAPHERQAQLNHQQDLEMLARRGGLSPCEAIAVIEDRAWHRMEDAAAHAQLQGFVDAALQPKLDAALARIAALESLINNPHTNDFLEAVRTEAAHQRERWGTDHDAGKSDAEWFWLIGYVAGKALNTPIAKDLEAIGRSASTPAEADAVITHKRLHRIITIAAAALNWHAAVSGADTRMRPGIETPSV